MCVAGPSGPQVQGKRLTKLGKPTSRGNPSLTKKVLMSHLPAAWGYICDYTQLLRPGAALKEKTGNRQLGYRLIQRKEESTGSRGAQIRSLS